MHYKHDFTHIVHRFAKGRVRVQLRTMWYKTDGAAESCSSNFYYKRKSTLTFRELFATICSRKFPKGDSI